MTGIWNTQLLSRLDRPLGRIGVGLLGSTITERLVSAGWRVIGWDIDPDPRSALSALGGMVGGGAEGVVGSCGRILLSLPTDEVAAEVLRSVEAVLRDGQSLIDTSIGAPEVPSSNLGGSGHAGSLTSTRPSRPAAGSCVTARPCSWSAQTTRSSTLAATCSPASPPRTFRTGPRGSGARMKLVTNLVLGPNRAALAEGLAFAGAIGVDPSAALEVLECGMAYSWVMDVQGRRMVEGDFAPQARLSQHLKDVRLILREAERVGLALPLSRARRGLLERAQAAGPGGLDNGAVIEAIREQQSS